MHALKLAAAALTVTAGGMAAAWGREALADG